MGGIKTVGPLPAHMPGAEQPVPARRTVIVSAKKGQSDVEHLRPVSYETAGIREVQDLERWVLAKPEVLGEPLLVITDQFSVFEGARDRLDILCLDRQAHVVVVELKRTESAGYADLQSLRYAAMVRDLTLDLAAHRLSEYRRRKGKETSPDEAKSEILAFVQGDEEGPETTELDTEPRIIIGSPGFSDPLLATADFLGRHGIDVTCVSLDAYTFGEGHFILVPNVVFPIRQIAPLLRKIRDKEAARQSSTRTHSPPRLRYLIDEGQINAGSVLILKHHLPDGLGPAQENDPRFRATLEIEGSVPSIRWEGDGRVYPPSQLGGLATRVFKEVWPHWPERSLNGYNHWGSATESLTNWAQRIMAVEQDLRAEGKV